MSLRFNELPPYCVFTEQTGYFAHVNNDLIGPFNSIEEAIENPRVLMSGFKYIEHKTIHRFEYDYKKAIEEYNADNQTESTTTLEANQDIYKGSQTPQATPTIPTPNAPTVETRD